MTDSPPRLCIATRESPLALWQANTIKNSIETVHPACEVSLLGMTTSGDKFLQAPLSHVGGKSLFVKELEEALLDGRADLAVHSMKDVPMVLPEGLALPIICEREDPTDAFVSNHYERFEDLPKGAVVGTSSLRRQSQLLHWRPDLTIQSLRGNVNTRLRKLDEGNFDAIVLASAGLKRLGFQDRIRHPFSVDQLIPAVGQGAMGIECRENDAHAITFLQHLSHPITTARVMAERAMNAKLNGGCQVPVAGHAQQRGDTLVLTGWVASLDGQTCLQSTAEGPLTEPVTLGERVGDDLLSQGARELLQQIL